MQTVKDGGTSAVFLRKTTCGRARASAAQDAAAARAARPAPVAKREARSIDALTLPNTFPAHYESLPDGDAILVLDVSAQPSS